MVLKHVATKMAATLVSRDSQQIFFPVVDRWDGEGEGKEMHVETKHGSMANNQSNFNIHKLTQPVRHSFSYLYSLLSTSRSLAISQI
jgi:hypothetical protein